MADPVTSVVDGERTKYKAIVRWIGASVLKDFGVAAESRDEKLPAGEATRLADVLAAHKLSPTRNDRRFPNQNQAPNCWTAFNEYQLCAEKRGKDDLTCLQRGRDYTSVCPEHWVAKWKEDEDKGVSLSVGKGFVIEK